MSATPASVDREGGGAVDIIAECSIHLCSQAPFRLAQAYHKGTKKHEDHEE
jgi:hypothetical protein